MRRDYTITSFVGIALAALIVGCSSPRVSGPGKAPSKEGAATEAVSLARMNQDLVFLKRSVSGIREGQMNAMSELSDAVSRIEKMEANLELLSSEVEELKQAAPVAGVRKESAGKEVLFRKETKPETEAVKPETQAAVDPKAAYDEAYKVLQQGEFSRAADMFRSFVSTYANHPLADNAQYWLGETYYSRKAYLQALDEFQKVERNFPKGNKVPDAMLKVGLSYYNLKEWNLARAKLMSLVERYPDSSAARIARSQLQKLRFPSD